MPCFATATHIYAIPSLFIALPRAASPPLVNSTPCIHSRCCSLLFHALPCLCKSPQFVAFPLRCVSRQCHSHAIISNSELCRCGANHVGSMQFHCSSEPCFAIPLQVSSNHRIAAATDCLLMLFPCNSEHYLAFPLHLVQDFVSISAFATVSPLADATQSAVVQPFTHDLLMRIVQKNNFKLTC